MAPYRVWIGGTRDFNNYALAYWFFKRTLVRNAIILSGHAAGPDTMGEIYGRLNGHAVEVFPADWERYGKAAGMIRNAAIARLADHAICFWDGKSAGTANMIELCKKRGIKPMIYDITERDYIRPHAEWVKHVNRDEFDIYGGRGKNTPWGNPFPIKSDCSRIQAIYMFTDYLLKTPELLSRIEELRGKSAGCFCSPDLCHLDVYYWLLENAMPEIKEHLIEITKKEKVNDERSKNSHVRWAFDASKWPEKGTSTPLYTNKGLMLSKQYERIIYDEGTPYFEIKSTDIIKNNLHVPLKVLQQDMDLDDRVSVAYVANDSSKTNLRYQQVNFDNCEFKAGHWYVKPYTVITY